MVFQITEPIGNFILVQLLLPLQAFLMEAPWFTTLAGLTLIAFVISGLRPAITTFLMLALIGFMGVWALAMDTLSQVVVATVIAVILGFGLGVWASESRTVSSVMRPINDVLQTLPQLVYIIPFIYLMPVSIVPGIVAAVLYAFPVVVRLVERGLKDVAPESVEAAGAFGATRGQILRKVKIPLAGDTIMLGVNQGIIMVLAVVVIGGLVGSGGLGYEVAQGLVRGQFGQGVIASIAILALGITLDRVTQGARQARKEDIGVRLRANVNDKEGRMSNRQRGRRIGLVALAVAVATALVAVAVASAGGTRQAACGTVILNENSWVGSTANVYVVKNVLEKRLKCTVKVTNITENQPSFQAMADGKIDVVLEDWDNTLVPSNKKYLTSKAVVPVGGNGITGVIGWYIPRYLLKQYPQFKTWKGLKGKESVFKTPGVGSEGDVPRRRPVVRPEGPGAHQGARPRPEARRLGRRAGAGRALDAAVQAAQAGALLLVRPAVPERGVRPRTGSSCPKRFKGCLDDEKLQRQARVRVPVVRARQARLEQVREERLAGAEGDQEVQWTSADQNFVANLISGKQAWTRTRPPQRGWRRTRPRSTPG